MDCLNEFKDIKEKTIDTIFEKYFLSFFKKTLSGKITKVFLTTVEYYLRKLVSKGVDKLNEPLEHKNYPAELFNIKTKKKFLSKIVEFEEKDLESWADALIRFYCLPIQEYRESCLRDIILTLTI